MLGDPLEFRNAAHLLELAEFAETATAPELRRLAEIRQELAAELDFDEALLKVLAEIDLNPHPREPYEVLPYALKIDCWPSGDSRPSRSPHWAPIDRLPD
jgi:hypothetical protein